MTKRRKKIAFFIISIPIIIVVLHFNFYFAFKKVIHADKSVNPIATNYFAHAMLVDMGAKLIHDYMFVDYDSLILKPLLSLEDYLFQIGKKYINPDNIAEEGAWWALLHMDKYGLIKTRNDTSMGLSRLSNEESLAIRNKAYSYFLTIVDSGVKGIDLKDKEFSAVYALFVIPFKNISEIYPGATKDERMGRYWNDKNNYKKEFISYQKYKKYIFRNPYYKEKYIIINNAIISRLFDLLAFNYLNNHQDDLCGPLLDDYLTILASPGVEPNNIGKPRMRNIKVILSVTANACHERKSDIISIQKKFHNGGK
jgi:hypothetical protein